MRRKKDNRIWVKNEAAKALSDPKYKPKVVKVKGKFAVDWQTDLEDWLNEREEENER